MAKIAKCRKNIFFKRFFNRFVGSMTSAASSFQSYKKLGSRGKENCAICSEHTSCTKGTRRQGGKSLTFLVCRFPS